jgi:hypothetical protein
MILPLLEGSVYARQCQDNVNLRRNGKIGKMWAGLWVGVFGVTSDNSFRKNGGDDGTRTRGLCRDSAA